MKAFSIFCMAFLMTIGSFAQTNTPTLKGTVMHSGVPVDKATVTLHAANRISLKRVITNANGHFSISLDSVGSFLVSASSVGMETEWSELILVKDLNDHIEIPAFSLLAAVAQLNTVEVVGRKPLIEQKIDRMVVNVDASPANVGITALEVLERTPGVSVDKDGNISLKGKSGVLILLDGKPSYLSNADVANLLRSMPSSQLEQLEIMTNPPAKYDAAGNAGVINIKTKKNKARGFNGNLTAGGGFGLTTRTNNSLNLNYRHNKVNVFANYSYNNNGRLQEMTISRKFIDATNGTILSLFDQETGMEGRRSSQTAKLGLDFFATKNTTFGILFTGLYAPDYDLGGGTTFIKSPDGEVQTRMEAISKIESLWKNGGINLNFRHVIDSTGREITADADYLGYRSGNDQSLSGYFYDKAGNPNAPSEIIRGSLPSDIQIFSAKVDYTHPLKNGTKLEAGAKSSFVNTDNNAVYQFWANDDWQPDVDRSNHFQYEENINALYVNASKEINKKWSGQLGLRLENTIATGKQLTTNENFDRNYTQLFPTAYASYKASDANQLTLSYGRRIQRPNYQDMNPFFFFLDKYTFQVGNPYLRPQFSHNIDFTHTFKGFLTTTLNLTSTKDIINQLLEQDDANNTTFVKMGNIARQKQIGLSVSAGFPITKWWNTNLFANGFYNEFAGPISGTEVELSAPGFMANVQNVFKFKKGWGGELSGFYRSKTQEGVFTAQSMSQMSIAVSKQVLKTKGSLRLNIRDPFDWQFFRGSAKYANVDVRVRNHWDNRTVYASFTYRFGKPIQGPQNKRKNASSEEQNRIQVGN